MHCLHDVLQFFETSLKIASFKIEKHRWKHRIVKQKVRCFKWLDIARYWLSVTEEKDRGTLGVGWLLAKARQLLQSDLQNYDDQKSSTAANCPLDASNNLWRRIKSVSRVFALFARADDFRARLTSLNWGHKSSYNQNLPASTKASNFFIIAMSNKFFPLISFSLPPTVFNLFRHNGKRYDVPHAISTPLSPNVIFLPLTVGLSNKDRIVKNWQGEILCEQKNMVRNNFVLNCPIFPKIL